MIRKIFYLVILSLFFLASFILSYDAYQSLSQGENPLHAYVKKNQSSSLSKFFQPRSPVYAEEDFDKKGSPVRSAIESQIHKSALPRSSYFFKEGELSSLNGRSFYDEHSSLKEESINPEIVSEDPPSFLFQELPSGIINEYYCQYLNPLSGFAPYQWQKIQGVLPQGLSLDTINGYLCGTPREGGVWTFDMKIMDELKRIILIRYHLVIAAFHPEENQNQFTITMENIPDGWVGTNYVTQIVTSGGALPHTWSVSPPLPAGLNLETNFGMIYGTPQSEGQYNFSVSVQDKNGSLASKSFDLTIKTSPLYLTTSSLSGGLVGVNYSFSLQAQGGSPPYGWQIISGIIPQGLNFNVITGTLEGLPLKAETQTLRFQVTDTAGNADSVDLPMNVASTPLTITTASLIPGITSSPYYTQLQANGGVPPYQWSIVNGTLSPELSLQPNGTLLGTPSSPITTMFRFQVTDQTPLSVTKELELIISTASLQITTSTLPDAQIGVPYQHQIQAVGGISPYWWEIISGNLPEGINFTNSGILSGIPVAGISNSLTFKVTDDQNNSDTKNFNFVVNSLGVTILSENLPAGIIQQSYQTQLQAQGGVPPYTWNISIGNPPQGLSLNAGGLISGTPQEHGIFPFDVRVLDTQGNFGTKSFSLTVLQSPLQITTTALPNGNVGVPYSVSLEAEGGIAPYRWSTTLGGLPAGLTLDSTSGLISGMPTQSGNSTIRFQVLDTLNNSDFKDLTLFVQGASLSISTVSFPNGHVNTMYQQTLQAQGGTPPYVWNTISGNLPAGLTLSKNSGIISGLPTKVETANFTIEVQDQEQNRTFKALSVRITPQPLAITTSSLSNGQVNQNYNFTLTAVGGTPPYSSWQISSGQLPEGLSLGNQTALLSGIPTVEVTNLPLTFRVTDAANNFVDKSLNLTINPATLGPVTGFIAQGSNQKTGLAWVNPSGPDFDHVVIVQSTTGFAQSPNEGAIIYSGTNNNIVDQNLNNNTTYYYSAFAYDKSGNFTPPASEGQGTATPMPVSLSGPYDPFVDEIISFSPLDPANCFGCANMPTVVLGPPKGAGVTAGSLDVVSLNAGVNSNGGATPPYGGSITLRFKNNIVFNGPGVDFIIFENAFQVTGTNDFFMEPAIVEVSYDGINFYQFPFDFVPHYSQGQLNLKNPFSYTFGFAGVNPVISNNGVPDPTNPQVSGGDSFDLSQIGSANLTWIQYIKITSTGDNWLLDMNGDYVRHTNERPTWGANGVGNSGFDLDAVSAVNY